MEVFWIFVAAVIFFLLVWRPASKAIVGALDARAEKIRAELDEAQRLREEAQALLAKYQRQLHDGENLAQQILERAGAETQRLEKQLREELEAAIVRRTHQATERIQQEEARALAEVRARAADLAVRTTRELLAEKLDAQRAKALIADAIEDVGRKLAS